MDFKVAGTERGVTALQMDIKIEGITKEIMQVALPMRARAACISRYHEGVLEDRCRDSSYAPRIIRSDNPRHRD